MRPEKSEAAKRRPSRRKEREETTSVKEEMAEEGETLSWERERGEKRDREVEWAAAKM